MKTKQLIQLLSAVLCFGSILPSHAAITLTEVSGWFESGYVTWVPTETAQSYNVYYKASSSDQYIRLDDALVRDYGTYGRADVVGLQAGQYCFRVVPVDASGAEMINEATESAPFTAVSYNRGGYAHFGHSGVGAYNDNGTLKAGAKVIYVHADNAKTISCDVVTSSKGTVETRTGLQNIIAGYEKGYDSTPLAIRIIGTIRDSHMDSFGSSSEGLQVKGKKNTTPMNITIEGIGNDATIWGFGLLLRNVFSVELRNFAIMLCMDDCVSIDTDNRHVWVHHLDLFYGNAGGDSDQAKGDGVIDLKGDSQYITVDYNHFWDTGKSSLCGMKSESGPNWITYHHNWFDHSDSRHPRIRTMSVHVYNNYFDGNSKYGVGVTTGANAFVENNYFRSCSRPMMISLQGTDTKMGTDLKDAPTFSGESGGMIKSYGNIMTGNYTYVPYSTTHSVEFDAFETTTREEQVPSSVKAKQGGYTYSNFDTNASTIYTYKADAAADVPSIVTGQLGAGRIGHGDFRWTFDYEGADTDYGVITDLKKALQDYTPTLVGFYGKSISGEGTGGNGDSGSDDNNTDNGGTGGDDDTDGDNNTGGDTPTLPDSTADTIICVFSGKKPSNPFFSITGNYSDSKGSATIDGVTYNECLKIESSTQISFTTERPARLKVVFGSSETPSLKVDGIKISALDNATIDNNVLIVDNLTQGNHTLTKDKSVNVFYIAIYYYKDGTSIRRPNTDYHSLSKDCFDLHGRRIRSPHRGDVIIREGKKIILK